MTEGWISACGRILSPAQISEPPWAGGDLTSSQGSTRSTFLIRKNMMPTQNQDEDCIICIEHKMWADLTAYLALLRHCWNVLLVLAIVWRAEDCQQSLLGHCPQTHTASFGQRPTKEHSAPATWVQSHGQGSHRVSAKPRPRLRGQMWLRALLEDTTNSSAYGFILEFPPTELKSFL